ncbi:CotH kinase family protein [Marinicella sediminis]|uniref:CotH kinase family protein n=1 Tax=Marinicella sediminis TaxID=1792834 RepID=A0ABV7JCW8_9GAMM|nr:CotH kinase family protein [Marinicella sediminis]
MMIKSIKKIITLSLIVTLPINIFGIVWAINTYQAYHLMDEFTTTLPKGQRLERLAEAEYQDLTTKTLKLFGISQSYDAELILKDKAISQLNSNLPSSGMSYQGDAWLIMDGQALKGDARYRGDHYFHWSFPQKSWRFKASKKNIVNGMRKYNFILPKNAHMLSNKMSYELARQLGLLAPEARLLELGINGNYSGPRLLVEQIGESFLRKNRRMPNDVYVGDNIGSAYYEGVHPFIFNHASIWDKASSNNHYPDDSKRPLEVMIQQLEQDRHDLIDLRKFAAKGALIDLTASYHHDNKHNWKLLYDGYYERIEPIVWDTLGWMDYTARIPEFNIANSKLMASLNRNYDYLRAKSHVLKQFYQSDRPLFDQSLKNAAEQAVGIIENNGFAYELDGLRRTEDEAKKQVQLFTDLVDERLNMVKDHFLGDVDPAHFAYQVLAADRLRIQFADAKMIKAIQLQLPAAEMTEPVSLAWLHNEQWQQQDISHLVSRNDQLLVLEVELLANNRTRSGYAGVYSEPVITTIDVLIEGADLKQLTGISLELANLSEQRVLAEPRNDIRPAGYDDGLQNIIPPAPVLPTTHLSGLIEVNSDLTFHEDVVIAPGTTFMIGPQINLRFFGHITAHGTAEQPISFQPADPKSPWGAVAIKDEGANGSRFSHCEFIGGSGAKGDLFEYTAMLSIHNVRDIAFEHCGFYDSKITDDMIHVIYSEASFSHSVFVRSLADALDADISELTISHCEFIDNGNDSIDLMTARAVVHNTRFLRSADKGISIGEGSQLLAFDNHIEDSEIGMQSKDTSLAYIFNTDFIGNNKAIDAYHKNWRYAQGGQINLHQCRLEANQSNATVDKKSSISLNQCQIDDPSNIDLKDQQKQRILITDQHAPAVDFTHPFFQPYLSDFNQPETHGRH